MRDSAFHSRADLLCVLPQIPRAELMFARLPILLARSKFVGGQFHVDRASNRIDRDEIAILEKPDRAANSSFRTDVADAEAARRAGEATIGDERNLAAH